MRLRQLALVAADRDRVVDDLCAVLGVDVCFNDPEIKFFGLHNALLAIGDTFLEVVAPIADDAAAGRYRDRRGGDSGYMVLLQTDDWDSCRIRAEQQGLRIVWKAELPEIRGMHFHPHDTGGALLSIDQPVPRESWKWAGPDWRSKVRSDGATQITRADMECADPERTSARWSALLDRPAFATDEGFAIALDGAELRFVPGATDGIDGLIGFRVAAADPAQLREVAESRGLVAGDGAVRVCGTRIDFD